MEIDGGDSPSGLQRLRGGTLIPTKELLTLVHDEVIEDSIKTTNIGHQGTRDDSILDFLCYKLEGHRYKEDAVSNAYYVGTETFFTIACRHPFIDGNKRTAYASSTLLVFANLSEALGEGASLELAEEADTGKTIETIARWGEGSDSSSLEKMVLDAGLLGKGKGSRKMREEDVKRFINKFLRNTIRVHEEDSHA
jgi:prophage maintenance system killer protein